MTKHKEFKWLDRWLYNPNGESYGIYGQNIRHFRDPEIGRVCYLKIDKCDGSCFCALIISLEETITHSIDLMIDGYYEFNTKNKTHELYAEEILKKYYNNRGIVCLK